MTYFAPASITCFFSAIYGESPLNSGSLGVGITLEKGSTATVNESGKIIVNGEIWKFPTVEYVLEKLNGIYKDITGTGKIFGVNIDMEVPAGCGFGMSGASALATAFEVSDYFELGLDFWEVADLAHEAEVFCRTGLGDVCCQSLGGVVIRNKACSPSLAVKGAGLERLDWDLDIDVLVIGNLSTKSFLESSKLNRINEIGKDCLKRFIADKTIKNLFEVSRRFSLSSGLADARIAEIINIVEESGGMASMVMLGRSVFAQGGFETLKMFGNPNSFHISKNGVIKVKKK